MASVEITDSNFDDVVEKNSLVLLDFWAEWCGPCHAFAPFYESASEKHPEIVFGKIDTESESKLAKEFEVRSVPTILAIHDGTIVYARPGALPPHKLDELILQLKSGELLASLK